MKIKIKVTTGDEQIIRVATKKNDVITYKESPNVSVTLIAHEDFLEIEKIGAINYKHSYKNKDNSKLIYIVKTNGQEFEGSSKVKTLEYSKTEKEIFLKCFVNDELVKINWEVM